MQTNEAALHNNIPAVKCSSGSRIICWYLHLKVTVSFRWSVHRVCPSVDGNRRGQALPGPELLASFMCPFELLSVCQ